MAQIFKSKTLLSRTGIFSSQLIAPNLIYNTGDQTISGNKNFTQNVIVGDQSQQDLFVVSGNDISFGVYPTINGTGIVYTQGDQNISGIKTFASRPTVNGTGVLLSGEAAALPNTIVYTTGDQTISGLKDFSSRPTVNTVPVLLSGENSNGLTVLVKNDEPTTLLKGQPVYIYGANGNNILVRKASNTGEAYSSKTFGLLAQNLASNAQGFVITEGALEGVDTSLAGSVGDPIWLGPTGDLIFGLVNKPYAPNHLVYLGVVERKQANNGKIYVKVQNGFELHELHNVNINHTYPLSNNDVIRYDAASGLWFNQALNTGMFKEYIDSLSGEAVLKYGYQNIYGTKAFRDSVYINNLYVTGSETILNTINNNIASPYLLLNLTGGLTDGGIFFVTGSGLTGINNTGVIFGFDNVTKSWHFGQGTRLTDISTLDEVMGYHDLSGYSGYANQTFSTIINLANTGSNLQGQINNLGNTYASVTNLASTGSTLDTKINNLSGYINSSSSDIVFTTGNQSISGNKTFNNGLATTYISGVSGSSLNIIGLSGEVLSQANRSINIQAGHGPSGIPVGAGSININAGNGLNSTANGGDITLRAGNSANTFATLGSINLIAGTGGVGFGGIPAGINLYGGPSPTYNGYNNIFGNINVNVGSSAFSPIGPRTIYIYRSGNSSGPSPLPYQQIGILINNDKVDVNNGMVLQVSGVAVTPSLYATAINLASTGSTLNTNLANTGSTLNSNINSLSGLFTGYTGSLDNTYATDIQLADTGSTLDTKINNVSGYFTGTNATLSNNLASTGSTLVINLASTGSTLTTNLATTGSTLDTKINDLSGIAVLKFGDQTITGIKTFINNIQVSGTGIFNAVDFNNIDIISLSGVDISITNGNIALTNRPTVNGTGVLLSGEASAITLPTTIVYTTGDQIISGNKTFVSGVTFSGQNINIIDASLNLSGVGDMTFSQTNINFIDAPVFISGTNLRVSGGASFTTRPTVNGTGVLLSGEAASLPTTIVYTTGNQIISGVKTFIENTNISGNLNVTGNSNIRGTLDVTGLVVSGLGTPFILKSPANYNSVYFDPTSNGNTGSLFSDYVYVYSLGSRGDQNFDITYGGGGTRSLIFKGGGANVNRVLLDSNGNFGIGSGISSVPSRFYVSGNSVLQGDVTVSGNTTITGHLSAASKSFLIDHPTQIGKKLQYGSLEGPEHGVFVRGKTNDNIINLPNYWPALVDENSISVNLTPISAANNIYVVDYNNSRITTNGNNGNYYFYTIYGERKDIPKLTVEF